MHVRIQINAGKTQMWNRSGERPEVCNALERCTSIQSQGDRMERVAVAFGVARHQNFGHTVGHPDFVARRLEGVLEEQRVFWGRIPLVSDIQSASLLLLHCANARGNYQIRSVTPEGVEAYVRAQTTRSGNASRRPDGGLTAARAHTK